MGDAPSIVYSSIPSSIAPVPHDIDLLVPLCSAQERMYATPTSSEEDSYETKDLEFAGLSRDQRNPHYTI